MHLLHYKKRMRREEIAFGNWATQGFILTIPVLPVQSSLDSVKSRPGKQAGVAPMENYFY